MSKDLQIRKKHQTKEIRLTHCRCFRAPSSRRMARCHTFSHRYFCRYSRAPVEFPLIYLLHHQQTTLLRRHFHRPRQSTRLQCASEIKEKIRDYNAVDFRHNQLIVDICSGGILVIKNRKDKELCGDFRSHGGDSKNLSSHQSFFGRNIVKNVQTFD